MRRRSLLAGVAASSAAVAGCFSTDATVVQESTTTVEVPDDPDEPIARTTVGTQSAGDAPHRVRCWNRADERRTIGLEIASDRAQFDGEYDLAPDAHVVVVLYDRAAYDVTVTVDGTAAESATIEADSFDEPCPATEVFVLEDGDVELTRESESDHC